MANLSFQIELEKDLRAVRKKINLVKDPAKKSNLLSAYDGLVELLRG